MTDPAAIDAALEHYSRRRSKAENRWMKQRLALEEELDELLLSAREANLSTAANAAALNRPDARRGDALSHERWSRQAVAVRKAEAARHAEGAVDRFIREATRAGS